MTLDARADLLDRLPKRDNVEKNHAVVSTVDGGPTTVPFYYVCPRSWRACLAWTSSRRIWKAKTSPS